ncbi:MAG: DNA translocase FtsK 4TM domain-containing protein, partial [Bryobacteraceae bacterium]
MRLLRPTEHRRLNEATGLVLLAAGVLLWLSLLSYQPQDPSWNTAATPLRPTNLVGYAGSYLADVLLQTFGLIAFAFPVLALLIAWKWLRSEPVSSPREKTAGCALLVLAATAALGLAPSWRLFGAIPPGGALGLVLAGYLIRSVNLAGAIVVTATALALSVYLLSTFTMSVLGLWLSRPAQSLHAAWTQTLSRLASLRIRRPVRFAARKPDPLRLAVPVISKREPLTRPLPPSPERVALYDEEIPICPLQEYPPEPAPVAVRQHAPPPRPVTSFELPATALLNEPAARSQYDEMELKETAVRVKSKFEEFNVLGSVVQINPGPVVTTFEFKPEAGIKYSRMTTLTEDLCLGLQAESILIERIPGRPTVGIEVPNSKREVISLRQILESDEFQRSTSHLTIPLGKDINGRIRVAALETMPHLLIAGSTGSGKSVMINSMIMSILYKSTPDEVRMIMIDPKRLELGLYEGIPHLLTPVITDPKKAANALRNAVLEMERRLRLLAERGVRSIDQYNRKIRQLHDEPRSLFTGGEPEAGEEDLRPLPWILILIDELADLM